MIESKIRIIVLVMLLCLSPIFAQGQQLQLNQQQPQSETQQLYQQYAQINQQLQLLQQQAMQDEAIAKKGEALDEKITSAMVANNPKIQETLDKREAIINGYQLAQQSGDQQALATLSQQYQTLSQEIQTEQQKVMQNPELQSDMTEFETMVMNKMEEINPNTQQLISKARELQGQLIKLQQNSQN